MSTVTDPTSVSITLTIDAPVEHCFKVFTDDFSAWWPAEHHIGKAEMADCLMDARVGGRWYEIGVDGSECEWGSVLAWDPPRHVALSWHLNGEFEYVADPARASRVDVRFTEEDGGGTRVDFVHSQLDRHGATWEQLKAGVASPGGWPGILDRFSASARGISPI